MKIISAEHLLPISSGPIENGAVAFENDRIVAVGTRRELSGKYPSAETEDFGEAAILPGFVNAHAHLELSAMRGFLDTVEDDFGAWLLTLNRTRADKLTDEDIENAAVAGALEGARAGVTCFGDIGRYGRAGLNALKANGMRGLVYQETEFSPDDKTAAADFFELKEKFLGLKEDETALVKMGLSPHSPYTVGAALLGKIAEYAVENEIRITIHAAESADEQQLMLEGAGFFEGLYRKFGFEWSSPHCTSIEYLERVGALAARPLLAHCVRASESDIEMIVNSGSSIAHCPKSNAKLGHGIAPLEKFLALGAKVGFGTDSVASNNGCDLLEEARFGALSARNLSDRKRFLEPAEMLETATLGGARALGLENLIGSLEAGKQADLIVVSLENVAQMPVHDVHSALLFASNARDVRLTVVAGEALCRDGEALKVDEREIKAKLREIRRRMN